MYKKNTTSIDDSNNAGYSVSNNEKEQVNKTFNMTSAVTAATVASVYSALMLSRGANKNSTKLLNKLRVHLEERLNSSTIKESEKLTDLYEFFVKRVNMHLNRLSSINNITSLKDVLFMKLMFQTKPTQKIHQSITNYFERQSRQTISNSYKKTKNDFEKMNQIFDKLDEKILSESGDKIVEHKGKTYTYKEFIDMAKKYRESATNNVYEFMSPESQNERYKYINKVTSNLYSNFWDLSFKDFWSKNNKFKRKDMYQTFIAAEQIKGDKTRLAEKVIDVKKSITCVREDKIDLIDDYITKLNGIVPLHDKEGMEIIKNLEWYTKYSEGYKYNKNSFLNELRKLEEHRIPTVSVNDKITKEQEEYKNIYTKIIRDLMNDEYRGDMREMLALYYKISPYELTNSGAYHSAKKAYKSFNKSAELETVEFFDKIRDLRLGSAPTDVLTILFSFVALSCGFGYAKSKDERISVMYKAGIPVVGGIATTILATARLISGGKSLMLGVLSSIILNRLGNIANYLFIDKNKTQEA